MNTIRTSPRPISRRRLLVGLAVAPALAALLVACGSQTTDTADTVAAPTTIPTTVVPDATAPPTTVAPTTEAPVEEIAHATSADSIILQLKFEGGFVPPGVNFAQLPTLLIAGDGRVYQEGVTTGEFPGVLVHPVQVRTLTAEGIQTILRLAEEAGLLAEAPDYTGAQNVADAPDTVLTINAGGGEYVHRAYALGIGGPSENEESSPARQALLDFVNEVGDLTAVVGNDAIGEQEIFEPTEFRFQALPFDKAALDTMEPEPLVVNWSDEIPVRLADATECAVVPAATIGEFFGEMKQNTVFLEGDRETESFYQLAVVAVLPGDPGC